MKVVANIREVSAKSNMGARSQEPGAKSQEYPFGESLKPIACHLKHSPGCTGTYKVDFSQEPTSGEGLAPALGVEEKRGRRTEATCRLNHEGDNGSGWEGGGDAYSGVVLSFRPFVRRPGSGGSGLGASGILLRRGPLWLRRCRKYQHLR